MTAELQTAGRIVVGTDGSLRADKAVDYGNVMDVMNLLRAAGYGKIALVGLEGGPAP